MPYSVPLSFAGIAKMLRIRTARPKEVSMVTTKRNPALVVVQLSGGNDASTIPLTAITIA